MERIYLVDDLVTIIIIPVVRVPNLLMTRIKLERVTMFSRKPGHLIPQLILYQWCKIRDRDLRVHWGTLQISLRVCRNSGRINCHSLIGRKILAKVKLRRSSSNTRLLLLLNNRLSRYRRKPNWVIMKLKKLHRKLMDWDLKLLIKRLKEMN